MPFADERVRASLARDQTHARALVGSPSSSRAAGAVPSALDVRARVFEFSPAFERYVRLGAIEHPPALSTLPRFIADVRSAPTFDAVGACRELATAYACARASSRAPPSERIADERARARAMMLLRGNIKWAWARESTARGARMSAEERYEDAEACFARALELDPRHARAFVARGQMRARRREFAKANEDFERALAIDAGDERTKALQEATRARAREIEDERRARASENASASAAMDVDALRERLINPPRGLDALRRASGGERYELELEDASERRRGEKRRKGVKSSKSEKRRRKEKKRKKSSKTSRRDASSSSSSSSSLS